MAVETKTDESPPYIANSTFSNFIKGLGETGVPERIDKTLLRSYSGSNQSALVGTLKWFRLIDDAGKPSPELERLAKSSVDTAPGQSNLVLAELIKARYAFVSDGSLTLTKATGGQIEEKFRDYGVSGSTIGKAMAFFISACKDAGIPLSPHIKLPKVVARTTLKGKRSNTPAATQSDQFVPPSPPPPPPPEKESPASILMKKFPDFDPTWTPEIQTKWFEAFEKMQSMLDK